MADNGAIDIVMQVTSCTREQAISKLAAAGNDTKVSCGVNKYQHHIKCEKQCTQSAAAQFGVCILGGHRSTPCSFGITWRASCSNICVFGTTTTPGWL